MENTIIKTETPGVVLTNIKEVGCDVFSEIYVTKNYSLFNFVSSNRKLNPVNYSKLLRSMQEEQLIIPICVNEHFQVIDGQHRLKACETLGLPVYFYILKGYSTSQMKRANLVSSNWKKDDFLNAYVSENNQNYVDFYDMKERHGINTTDLIRIISKIKKVSSSSLGVAFEEGDFELTREERINISDFLLALEDFNFFIEYKRTRFISAFLDLYTYDGYDHRYMKNKIKTRKEAFEVQLCKDDYLKMLANKIYSFGQSKNNIFYDIDRKRLYNLN